jgi:hypothetical protein
MSVSSEKLLKLMKSVVGVDLRDMLRREFLNWYKYMFELYGGAKLDDWIARRTEGVGDPHWVAKTASGYIVLHDTTNDYLFIYDPGQRRVVKKFYLGGSSWPPKAGDVYPESDVIVFNNNGIIYEYDIRRDLLTPVADMRPYNVIHGQVIYNPKNRNELLITESGTNTLYVFDKTAARITRFTTLPVGLHWGGIVPTSFWGGQWVYQSGLGFVWFVEGQGILGDLPYAGYHGWVYAKGPFGTFGFEENYALLAEGAWGATMATFPTRSNNVFITDEFTYILTYMLSVYELTLRDALYAPKAPHVNYASTKREGGPLAPGAKLRYTVVMGNNVRCRAYFKASAPANFRVLVHVPYNNIYGAIWRDYSLKDTGLDFVTIYEKLNATNDIVELEGLFATLETENPSTATASIDAYMFTHCVGQ